MSKVSTNLKGLFIGTTLNVQLMFFSLYSIFGIEYKGIKEDNSYVFFVALFSFVCLFITRNIYVKQLYKNNQLFLVLPIIFLLVYVIELPVENDTLYYFLFFLVFSLPAINIGVYLANNKHQKELAKWIEITMLFMTMAIIVGAITDINKSNLALYSLAGASYQTVSYIAGLCFTINYLFLMCGKFFNLFKWHYTFSYRFISFIFLFIQLAAIIISGGRGGSVLAFIGFCIVTYIAKGQISKTFFRLVLLLFIGIPLIFLPKILKSDLLSFERIFSYFSSSGIDISNSGRQDVYTSAIQMISDKPVEGYGIFKYYDYTHLYPHNIWLEFLLQRGLIFLFFGLFVVMKAFLKYRKMCTYDKYNLCYLPLLLFPLVKLQFTETYMSTSLFWFALSYIYCYRFTSK